jgi:hypothetical protein
VLSNPEEKREPAGDRLVPLHPDALSALESQLRRPGDVSIILSEQDRFAVYRLTKRTDEAWTAEVAIFPKRDFESCSGRRAPRTLKVCRWQQP